MNVITPRLFLESEAAIRSGGVARFGPVLLSSTGLTITLDTGVFSESRKRAIYRIPRTQHPSIALFHRSAHDAYFIPCFAVLSGAYLALPPISSGGPAEEMILWRRIVSYR